MVSGTVLEMTTRPSWLAVTLLQSQVSGYCWRSLMRPGTGGGASGRSLGGSTGLVKTSVSRRITCFLANRPSSDSYTRPLVRTTMPESLNRSWAVVEPGHQRDLLRRLYQGGQTLACFPLSNDSSSSITCSWLRSLPFLRSSTLWSTPRSPT
uniref:Uncharacterized protein n=1 Tax=Ixodes ricinus TaxID=34613 RepID=A0A6B0UVF6_IXORI